MKSVAYATDDSASEESTANPVTRDSRSWWARLDGMGLPRRRRLSVGVDDSSATPAVRSLKNHACYHTRFCMRVARRYTITGRVQGVGFRFFTEDAARREGLHG